MYHCARINSYCTVFSVSWLRLVVSVLCFIDRVTLRWAWLVMGRVTIALWVKHLNTYHHNQSRRSAQPGNK